MPKVNVRGWPRDVQLAYLAAAIDGEGSIMMLRRPNGRWRPKIQISQTQREWLEDLHKIIGVGYIVEVSKKGTFKNDPTRKYKDEWMLMVDSPKLILKELLPYLLIKRQQAVLLLKYYVDSDKRHPIKGQKLVGGSKPRTAASEVRAVEIRRKIQELNRRGQPI